MTTKTYLLFTKNFSRASAEISKAGGHVTQKFTKTVFVANFPKPIKTNALKSCSIKPYSKLDALSTLMVKSWKSLQSKQAKQGKSKPAAKRTKSTPLPAVQLGNLKGNFPPSGTVTPTSEKMTGNIALNVVFVSNKTTGGLELSYGDVSASVTAIMASFQFLATAGGSLANITFHFGYQILDIDAVPNSSCQDQESCEAVFRDAALKKMGYQVGYQGCVDYVNDLKTKQKTDWAYMAFITKYPMKESGYAGGVRVCLHYPDFVDWSSAPMTSPLFTRLSCNIFGAADEDANSGCNCDRYGVNMVPNYNCANCQGVVKTSCLMSDLNAVTLCPWTMGQLGWINPRPYGSAGMTQFGNTFQVMYKDVNNQISQMSWNVNGGDWSYQNVSASLPVATKASGDPGITQYGSSLHAIYRDENNQISDMFFGGGKWYYQNISALLPQAAAMMGDPVLLMGRLHLVYRDANNHISYIHYDNGTVKWSYDDLNALLAHAPLAMGDPSIAASGKNVVIVYRDLNSHIFQITHAPNFWGSSDLHAKVPQAPNAHGDAVITQFGSLMVIAYWDLNNHISQLVWDGKTWTYQDLNVLMPKAVQIDSGLSMTSLNGSLHLVYRDVQGGISYMGFDGTAWNYERIYTITGFPPVDTPSITTFGNQLQVLSGEAPGTIILLYWNGAWNIKKYYP